MGALEEAHLASAACACEEEDDGLELLAAEGAAPDNAIELAVRALLVGLGEDVRREGLRRMPRRVAKNFRDGTRGYKQKVKHIVQGAIFPEDAMLDMCPLV